jgi:hypothetical protein
MLRNYKLLIVLNSTLIDSYRPIFKWNYKLLKILIYIYYKIKYSNNIIPMFIGSYLVSPSLLINKILVQ